MPASPELAMAGRPLGPCIIFIVRGIEKRGILKEDGKKQRAED
jgi:hypothetical protein